MPGAGGQDTQIYTSQAQQHKSPASQSVQHEREKNKDLGWLVAAADDAEVTKSGGDNGV